MKFRLYPTPEQEVGLLAHAAQARAIWNALVEQSQSWRRDKGGFPSWSEQSRQITEARRDIEWVGAGNREVQEKALRDFHLAMEAFWRGQHGHPTWRQRGVHESFRMSGVQPYHVRRLNRRWSQVHVQQIGAVRFRGTRPVGSPRSFVIRRDQAGRWWVSFPTMPNALKVSGGPAIGIAIEALKTPNMTRRGRGKRGLNRAILFQRWGLFAQRLEQKGASAGVPVVRVPAAYTSQRCSACGYTDRANRDSQAFACLGCGFTEHADTNAALNVLAAGLAVIARGSMAEVGPADEPRTQDAELVTAGANFETSTNPEEGSAPG